MVPLLSELMEKSGLSGAVSNIEVPLTLEPSPSGITGTLFDNIAASDGNNKPALAKRNASANDRCFDEVSLMVKWS